MTAADIRETYLVFGQPVIDEAMIEEVVDSLRSRWIGTGPKVKRLEDQVRTYVGAEHAQALNSATAGLHLSLLAAGIERGDEVITTSLTFVASANAILHAGGTPVFVDVDRATQNIDPERIAAAITPRTKAILPVHMAGRPCDMDAITTIAQEHGLRVIEDAAHALGASYHGRKIGTLSDFTVFSFYATKNITTAEGGMVTTQNREWAELLEVQSLHGLSRGAWERYAGSGPGHYVAVLPGYKYNLTDLAAAIGVHQMPHIDEWQDRRAAVWARYDEAFQDLPLSVPAPVEPDTVHARHLYTLNIDPEEFGRDRDWLREFLHTRRIGTGVHFIAVHQHPYYEKHFPTAPGALDNAEHISDRTVSLPMSPALTDDDVSDVIEAMHHAVRER